MPDHRRPEPKAESLKRQRRRQRAKRGLIAGYIHELSGRHAQRAYGSSSSSAGSGGSL